MSELASGPRYAAVLAALRRAEDGAVGIDGVAPGAVYVIDGCVAYAETPGTPGVGERLVAAGRLSVEQWSVAREIGERGGDVTGTLAAYGVDRHELAALTESVTVDSILALLTGPDGDDPVGRTRFAAGVRHWMDPAVRLDESALADVLALGAPDSAHATIRAETVVEPAQPRWRWRVITPDQWRAVSRMGVRSRVRDLALAGAMSVYDAVAQVAELVEAGLCTVVGAAKAPRAQAGPDWPVLPGPDAVPAAPPRATVAGPTVDGQTVDGPTVRIRLEPRARAAPPAVDAVAVGAARPEVSAAEPAPNPEAVEPIGELPRRLPGRSLSAAAPVLAARQARLRDGGSPAGPDEQTLRRLLGSLQQLD